MKKRSILGLALAVVLAVGSVVAVRANEKPKSELITGSISCMYCQMAKADMGPNSSGCIARCIDKKSMPPIIVQEGTGAIFVAVGKDGESAVKKLLPLVGSKVNVQGPVYRKDGLNMIEIQVVSEAM